MHIRNSQPVSFFIFGGGAVVHHYYLPAFEYLGLLSQVTVIEPDPNACKTITENFPVRVHPCSAEAFLGQQNDVQNGIAIIALPNHLHFDVAMQCITKNLHVLCEKPLAMSERECLKLHHHAARQKRILSAAMVRRHLPCFQALQMIKSEKFADHTTTVHIEDGGAYAWLADSRSFFEKKNGGVLADIGIHYLDQLQLLFGELVPVQYTDDSSGGVEANCTFRLRSASGTQLTLKLSRTHTLKNTFRIDSGDHSAWYNKNEFDSCYFSAKGVEQKITLSNPFPLHPDLKPDFDSCFVQQLEQFIQAVALDNTDNLAGANEAAKSVGLIEWAYAHRKKNVRIHHEPLRYLITGASGFIGTAIVERLALAGHRITAPVRSYLNCASIARFAIDMPKYDLLNAGDVSQQIDRCDHIIHLAYAANGENAEAVNVRGTQNIVRAAAEKRVKSMTVLSSIYVYGHPETDKPVDENQKFSPAGGSYGKTKAVMQRWCLDWAKEHPETQLSVLNPSCVFGPAGKTYTTLPYNLAAENRFCWVENGQGIANVVFIEDVSDAILLALHSPKAHGENFILNGNTLSWKEFLEPLLPEPATIRSLSRSELKNRSFVSASSTENVLRHLLTDYALIDLVNRHKTLGPVKRFLLARALNFKKKSSGGKTASQEKNRVKTIQRQQEFNPPVWLADLFGPTKTRFSSEKARQILGWQPRPYAESMANTVAWLKETNHV